MMLIIILNGVVILWYPLYQCRWDFLITERITTITWDSTPPISVNEDSPPSMLLRFAHNWNVTIITWNPTNILAFSYCVYIVKLILSLLVGFVYPFSPIYTTNTLFCKPYHILHLLYCKRKLYLLYCYILTNMENIMIKSQEHLLVKDPHQWEFNATLRSYLITKIDLIKKWW